MNRKSTFVLLVFAGLVGSAASHEAMAQVESMLGPAPRLTSQQIPEQLLQPQSPEIATISFDPQSRIQVALAYQTVYLPLGLIPIGWTGDVAGCIAGTTTTAYRQATIDRVNYYRAQAGLPGNVSLFGGSQSSGTQQAALMFSANTLSHDPPSSWSCWTQAGHDAAGNSNIARGSGSNSAAGVGAVDLYMEEKGNGNGVVGHRRWILFPPQVKMESGSIPYNPQSAANALWVFGPFGTRPSTPNGVAWPSRGYFPWQLLPAISNRWSFSWKDANFSSATVSMTRNGVPLGVPSYESIANGYGDNTLVWIPQGVTYSQPAADVTYHVTITGISGGGAPSTISYDVIAIDPYNLGEVIFQNGFD
ncbi:MAG: hypothetical protein ABIR27_09815 [Dokdonella sp.]